MAIKLAVMWKCSAQLLGTQNLAIFLDYMDALNLNNLVQALHAGSYSLSTIYYLMLAWCGWNFAVS